MITLLNTSILTNYGAYEYEPLTLEKAKTLVADNFLSAIGHESTAQILTELLGVVVDCNRIHYLQPVGGQAIIFKLRGRTAEGAILTRQEIEKIGFDFGLLTRFS